jgi:hypothetical protein
MARGTLFLERTSYRQRRLMDGVRVLPFVGLAFWMLPLLWPSTGQGSEETVSMSGALQYLFGIWIALILAALVLWLNTRARAAETPPTDQS